MATSKASTIPAFKTCKGQEIKEWCLANGKVEWLKEAAKDSNGRFFVLRNKFFAAFAPEKMPKAKPKKPTLWDEIAAL